MTDYQNEIFLDFAKRTRANLEFIDRAKNHGDDVHEVTQFVNSLLGLLVFPREQYIEKIPKTPLNDARFAAWPKFRTVAGQLPNESLYQLVRMLRNGIAHCNVEFKADADGQLCGLIIWNEDENKATKTKVVTWKGEISVNDLRKFAVKFVELIEAIA